MQRNYGDAPANTEFAASESAMGGCRFLDCYPGNGAAYIFKNNRKARIEVF